MTFMFQPTFPGWYTTIDSVHRSSLRRGHSVSLKTTGHNALLFSYQSALWIWTPSTGTKCLTVSDDNVSQKLSVFSVEVVESSKVYIVDTFIYNDRVVLGRDCLERMEIARHWIHDHPGKQRLPSPSIMTGITPFHSAYHDYAVVNDMMTITCKSMFPGHCANDLWTARHRMSFQVDGLVFNYLLSPREPGLLWSPPGSSDQKKV
jgi:hypothetical protein